jgi:TnpA family transposase
MSSSDGQRVPVRGKSTTAREMPIHGGKVLSTYTHVCDQHSTYGTKILISTQREAQFVLDDCWPDLLRMAGSLKYGQATASLVVGKWSAASRQNTLAAALKERGTLRRTIHTAKYLSDPSYRTRIGRQLNKGESLHALRRDLHYAQQGTVAAPHLADQTEQAWCLTVLTNAVITWTT